MSSDNLLARREARRRKILENSENRIKRITGRNGTPGNTESQPLGENGFVNINNDILSNGFITSEKETVTHFPSNPWTESTDLHDSHTESSISEHFDFLSSTSGVQEREGSPSLTNVASFLSRNSIYISMVILFRLLIEFNNHFICANSLVVAFLLTKLGVCGLYGLLIPETSRFLGSLLLLSGISPQKIKIFTLSMSIVYTGLQEFALCIFVFVICDLLINIYENISLQ